MNISHCLSNLDACESQALRTNLQVAEAALLQAVKAVAFSEMADRPSQRQRAELQQELSRMAAAIAALSGEFSPPSDSR